MPTPTFFGQNQVVVGGGVSTPTDIPNIWEWWEVSRQGLANNDPIATLVGQANGRNFTESNGANQPANVTGQLGGLSAIRFAGSPRAFGTGPDMSGIGTGAHIFCLHKLDNDPATSGGTSGFWRLGTTTGSNENDHVPFTDGGIYTSAGLSSRLSVGDPTTSMTNWFLLEIKIDGTSQYKLSLQTTAGSAETMFDNTNPGGVHFISTPLLGKSTGALYTVGHQAHLALYSAALGTTDRGSQISYMNTRFGTSFV